MKREIHGEASTIVGASLFVLNDTGKIGLTWNLVGMFLLVDNNCYLCIYVKCNIIIGQGSPAIGSVRSLRCCLGIEKDSSASHSGSTPTVLVQYHLLKLKML